MLLGSRFARSKKPDFLNPHRPQAVIPVTSPVCMAKYIAHMAEEKIFAFFAPFVV